MSKLIQNTVLGHLINELTSEGYRVEVTTHAGNMFLHAFPDYSQAPRFAAAHWIRIGDSGIANYSLNLEDVVKPALDYAISLRKIFED